MRRNRVYAGLSRPPQFLGLPALPALLVIGLSGFALMLAHWIAGLAVGAALYLALLALFQWEPQFPGIIAAVFRKTPKTKNRRIHGGDFYDA